MEEIYNIKEVKKIFDKEMKSVLDGIDNFPWHDKKAYCALLAQSYYMVRHTTRFASYAASRIGFENEALHKSLLRHLKEETGHEMLAFNDIKNLEMSVKDCPEMMETKLMIQSQYYWISQSPYTHYGFIWVLEALSVLRGKFMLDKVQSAYKGKCYSFIDVHSEEDGHHVDGIVDEIQKFSPEQIKFVIENVRQTSFLYSQMLKNITEFSAKKKKAA
jgi:hypothetical protein